MEETINNGISERYHEKLLGLSDPTSPLFPLPRFKVCAAAACSAPSYQEALAPQTQHRDGRKGSKRRYQSLRSSDCVADQKGRNQWFFLRCDMLQLEFWRSLNPTEINSFQLSRSLPRNLARILSPYPRCPTNALSFFACSKSLDNLKCWTWTPTMGFQSENLSWCRKFHPLVTNG